VLAEGTFALGRCGKVRVWVRFASRVVLAYETVYSICAVSGPGDAII
jgi:hypothetical protein